MLVEEVKRCINSDIKSFLDEKQVEALEAAACLADDFALTHKASFVNKPIPRKPFPPPTMRSSPIPVSSQTQTFW